MTRKYDPGLVTHPLHVAQSAALVGGAAAVPGLVTGALYGTLRTQTPTLFAIFSGAQCFAIGTTFWATRTAILNHAGVSNWWNVTRGAPLQPRDDLNPTLSDRVRASTIAGAFTGFSLGLLLRGPKNVIPGTIMFTLFGWSGQHGYNYLDKRNSAELKEQAQPDYKPKGSLMQRIAQSKWSPMSVLTDEQYEEMLQERLLKVEAEIAIIDERIDGIRKAAMEQEAQRALQEQDKSRTKE
ncbi:hypothetical protein IQ06DRAFT_289658 [Phaeosphaeriaceae sp. SRC1lsM3a]|nr:hypothetical protein IQ06DRAFT_289658 [Stagonospora sp. SRC1lsM3a]